ncbi:MAG: RluA family pseudouridine synthase [Patescibacteria group bacterium]|jgi:23S rRNA pseudouridine1911/1915/1917 synthase
MKNFHVTPAESGVRLDKILATRFPKNSRSTWQGLIENNAVMVNDHPIKSRYLTQVNDVVTIQKHSEPEIAVTKSADLDIIFENRDVVVINKPFGLITHPAHSHTEDSVAQRIIFYDPTIKNAVYDPESKISLMRPGIVHRLDKDTSGAMIIAKNKSAMTFLANQIQKHLAQKTYLALIYGWLEQDEITVTNFLGRDQNDRRKMALVSAEKGREAITEIKIVSQLRSKKGDKVTLIEARPITGRTHQIRVHCAYLGHPVMGDKVYTFKEASDLSARVGLHRQFLHASTLEIRLPESDTRSTFTAPLPADLEKALHQFE